jgi:DNA polymerase-1
LTPKLRQNLAANIEQVRTNTELIPLVRDVPLDVHVDQLTLGGWDRQKAQQIFEEFELRTIWTRFASLVDEGLFGEVHGTEPDGTEADGTASRKGKASPSWLSAPEVVVARTADAARAGLATVFAAARASTGNVAVHPRWAGEPGRSSLVSLSLSSEVTTGSTSAPVIYIDTFDEESPGLLGDAGVVAELSAGLGAGGLGVVAHDGKELMRSLLAYGIDITHLVMDTAVAAYLLDPSTDRYRLGDLAERLLGVTLDDGTSGKGQGSLALEPLPAGEGGDEVSAARVTAVLARLRVPLAEALAAVGEEGLYNEIELPLVRVLARMEVTGIPVDRQVLQSIAKGLADECQSLEATIQDLAGEPFKVNSVPQLRSVLYDKLGLKPARKTKTGFSTDARTLELLRGEHPIIEALLRYREIEKLRSTYGESLAAEVADDGRIHATFRQTVARTGRLSSDRPNLHNIPVRTEEGRRFREAFIPSPGRRLLVADYDQVELRAIAHLSADPGLTAAFAAGEDIHRNVASRVFGVERDEVTGGQRSMAKMVSYGLAYGMEAYGLSQRLAVPVEEAQLILEAYFGAFPSVRNYMEGAVSEARNVGYTVTAFGRRRPLPDLVSTNYQVRQAAERQAMNAGIQGLAADLFKVALIRLDGGLENGGFASQLVLQVHDEVLVDVVPDEEEAVAALTERALTGAADLSVPLKVAMAWGSSWAEAKGS